MNPELREHASRYVELLRRHGQRDVWLPSGLVRRLPTSTVPKPNLLLPLPSALNPQPRT